MNSIYLSSNEYFPAPYITPSHGDKVKYPEVTDRKGKIIIPAPQGLELGQSIHWSVKGRGVELSYFSVDDLKPEYEVVLRFNIVFDSESVVASYFVSDAGGHVIGYSAESEYFVQDRP